ncbi:MAG: cytidine deaminase [Halobacteriota archaeon]|uniref:hypothetical protein n=1 Tax=Natronomonas sp. TaxID=2184060 RepID=UPI003975B66B
MRTKPITDEDRELIAEAEALLKKLHVPGRHRCSAAVRASSGEIYTGINLITGGQADVHSEPVALGRAVMAGDDEIETSVAVIYRDDDSSNPMEVVSACGVCRELYDTFAPDVDVVVPGDDGPIKAPLSELLPAKGTL